MLNWSVGSQCNQEKKLSNLLCLNLPKEPQNQTNQPAATVLPEQSVAILPEKSLNR